ncbi:MAG TPA: hypothetical protein DEA22_12965, partial [Blastocatellia bacterium]|nr:hypothetical protein [Blastocatellia bacterium]
GDIIISIDGEKMDDMDAIYRFLDKKNFGDSVRVEVYRGGGTTIVPVRLTPQPQTRNTRRSQ